jgi:hypothetical protein
MRIAAAGRLAKTDIAECLFQKQYAVVDDECHTESLNIRKSQLASLATTAWHKISGPHLQMK